MLVGRGWLLEINGNNGESCWTLVFARKKKKKEKSSLEKCLRDKNRDENKFNATNGVILPRAGPSWNFQRFLRYIPERKRKEREIIIDSNDSTTSCLLKSYFLRVDKGFVNEFLRNLVSLEIKIEAHWNISLYYLIRSFPNIGDSCEFDSRNGIRIEEGDE